MNSLNLALYQMNISYEDKEDNYRKLNECLKNIDSLKTDILLLPEMSFTGFSMNTKLTKEVCENIDDSETVKRVAVLAKDYNIIIGFGWVRGFYNEALSENHYTIVDKSGEIILDYIKIHPFSYSDEDKYFKGGDKLSIASINGIEVGATICYDLRFPDIYMKLSEKAKVILVPANWPEKRVDHYKTLLKARAIETESYMIGINCMGEMGGQFYSGDSGIYGPDGKALEPLSSDICCDGKILTYHIDDNTEEIRASFPVRNDRREDLYKAL